MDKVKNVVRGAFYQADLQGITREELIHAMEWELISHSIEKGVSGYVTGRTLIALGEKFPGMSLASIINHNTMREFETAVKNKKVIEEVKNLLDKYDQEFTEGCIYCKSAHCIAFLHGESICG